MFKKVLVCHRPGGAFGYISDGWINSLRSNGHIVERWDNQESSWLKFKPDLYCGCSGHKQLIPNKDKRQNCKVAIHVNPYGPINIPGINENKETIDWVLKQKPDVVFGYGAEGDRHLWSYWTERHGIKWVPMPTAADSVLFKQTNTIYNRQYDIVYLGGRWPYKAKTIDKYLLPLLNSKLSYKLHGWGDWPSNLNVGPLDDNLVVDFLNSGKVGPCISEQHTHDFGIDIPERAFKLALCGTVIVHDSPSILKLIPSAIVASNTKDFIDKCIWLSDSDNDRYKLISDQQNDVLIGQTYDHRMRTLFESLGFI